jgi:hypothetical protein
MGAWRIVWTALPAGFSVQGAPLLSVHVAPRLLPGPGESLLSQFAEFRSWPDMALGPWKVLIGDDPNALPVDAVVVTGGTPQFTIDWAPIPDTHLWNAVFSNARVAARPGPQNLSQRKIWSYSTSAIQDWLADIYVNVGLGSGEDHPPLQQLKGFLAELGRSVAGAEKLSALMQQQNLFTLPQQAPAGFTQRSYDFARVKRFHTPPAKRVFGAANRVRLPGFDFHQMLALAQDHPILLRLLGLVIDLELDADALGNYIGSSVPIVTTVRAVSGATLPRGSLYSTARRNLIPRTRCRIGQGVFRAEPRRPTGEVREGFLALEDGRYFGVTTVDQDGAALKAIHFATQVSDARTADSLALPNLRARGLGIYRKERAKALRDDKLLRALDLESQIGDGITSDATADLYAEDLVQGARFDARDETVGRWRSLSARTGGFMFADDLTVGVHYDEAMSNTAATSAHDGSSTDLYLGEQVVTWNGFSLGAARPGKVIDDLGLPQGQESTSLVNGSPLRISYAPAEGSLPRLRFGHAYRLRARTVDLAGNSEPLTNRSDVHASPAALFGRFEPVQSPSVLLRTGRASGDSAERVVLRSNRGVPPTSDALLKATRHLAPPKTTQSMAELHGMFDQIAFDVAFTDPDSVEKTYMRYLRREPLEFTSGPVQGAAEVDNKPKGDGDAWYFDTDAVTAPYLPDPVAKGAVMRVEGQTATTALLWPGQWPDLRSVPLVVEEKLVVEETPTGSSHLEVSADRSKLVARMEKGDTLVVRLSSLADANAIQLFGMHRLLRTAPGWNLDLGTRIREGRHWMLTPFRTLTIVHAVKQPLQEAKWKTPDGAPQPYLVSWRSQGATFAFVVGVAAFSRKSTARIDLEAVYREYVDEGPGTGLPTRPKIDPDDVAGPDEEELDGWIHHAVRREMPISAPVSPQAPGEDVPINWWLTTEVPTPGPRHEFGDTKHREVAYVTRVYSRFDEYFREQAAASFTQGTAVVLDPRGIVAGSLRIQTLDGAVPRASYSEGAHFILDAEAGKVTWNGNPVTAEASWVPRPNDWMWPPDTTGDPKAWADPLVNVPSSARPDAPKIVYVIPTFQWQETSAGRNRIGGGLRVYLERPWWVSGGGEMLAVVMENPSQISRNPDLSKFVTTWGIDPLHPGVAMPDLPKPLNFPLRARDAALVRLSDLGGEMVTVAGHQVGFDRERDLWYCDIQIDTGATYFPFVRLALARWQPNSLPDLELSPVVLADFVQLAPDRFASVVKSGESSYDVKLFGPSYASTRPAAEPHTSREPVAKVTLQVRLPGLGGPLAPLAWQTRGRPFELARTLSRDLEVFFSRTVTLPKGVNPANARLLLEEFEQIRSDGDHPIGKKGPSERLVYADVLTLG